MNPEIVPYHRKDSFREEGMLFVRTEGILQTMVSVPLIVAGLIVVAFTIPIQNSFGLTRSLDLIIYPDGSTHVTSEFEVDIQQPDFEVNLFGSTVDNFVAIGENGFLLESQIVGDKVTIETLGISSVSIEYDIHDLVSKEGRVWSFAINAPIDYSLLMPKNSVIVGMSNLPLSMEISEEQPKLLLPEGNAEIDYIFGAPTITPQPPQPLPTPQTNDDNSLIIIGGAIVVAAGIIGAIYSRKAKRVSLEPIVTKTEQALPSKIKTLDPQTIFRLRPDLREDDKEIVSFIFENGGQAKESELRKKFLQPRTTMWRAVKRLERYGIIQIEKKDQQNLVKLKDELEEEQ
jgi:uncharacterized membrane protein